MTNAQMFEDDDVSTLASTKTSDQDEDVNDTSNYADDVWDEDPPLPKKDTPVPKKNTTVATDVSVSETTNASTSSRRSRRFSKRLQAASTPTRVYDTCSSVDVRRQGGN